MKRDEDFRAKVLIVSTSHCVSTESRAHVDFYLLYYYFKKKMFTVHTKLLWTKKKEKRVEKIADQGPETYINNDSGAFSLASQTAIQHAHETWDISKKTWHIVKPDLLQQQVSGREETLPFWIVAYERSVLALTSQKNLKKLFFFLLQLSDWMKCLHHTTFAHELSWVIKELIARKNVKQEVVWGLRLWGGITGA